MNHLLSSAIAAILLISPALAQRASDHEKRLAWAYLSFSAINKCYEGSLRAINRDEMDDYSAAVLAIQLAAEHHDLNIDPHLVLVDALRIPHIIGQAVDPSMMICNMARAQLATAYFAAFPERCPGTTEQCQPVRLCGPCTSAEFEQIKRDTGTFFLNATRY